MEVLIRCADRLGIERIILSQGYSADLHPTREQLREENDRVMRAVRRFPDRAYGSVYLSPSFLDFSLQEFDRCVRDGPMVGVGELEADMRCNAPELDPIVERAISMKAPILQHTWLKLDGNLPGESSPYDLVELARRHPGRQFHLRPHRGRLGARHSNYPDTKNICGRNSGIRSHGRRRGDGRSGTRSRKSGIRQRRRRPELRFATRQGYGGGYSRFRKGTGAGRQSAQAVHTRSASERIPGVIIDTNVNISRWPFRRLAGDETPDLVARLRKRNVAQAWAGSFDGILHKDIGGVNARLAAECNTHGRGFPGAVRVDQSEASRLAGGCAALRERLQDARHPAAPELSRIRPEGSGLRGAVALAGGQRADRAARGLDGRHTDAAPADARAACRPCDRSRR